MVQRERRLTYDSRRAAEKRPETIVAAVAKTRHTWLYAC